MIALLNDWLAKPEPVNGVVTTHRLRVWSDWALELISIDTEEEFRNVWHRKVRLRDLDPDQIYLGTASSGDPELTIYTKYFREAVAERSYMIASAFSASAYRRRGNYRYLMLPVREGLSAADVPQLQGELRAWQAAQAPMPHPLGERYVASLHRHVREWKVVVESLANHVDFTAHAGMGVVEQRLTICPEMLTVTLCQVHKHAAHSSGLRITSVIPLHALMRVGLYSDKPDDSPWAMARGIPQALLGTEDHHVLIKQHYLYSGVEFEHECGSEGVFVPTPLDVIRFERGFEDLIAAARELQHYSAGAARRV